MTTTDNPVDVLEELARAAGVLREPDMWQDRALCRETDPELFFPEKGGSTREAKLVCAGCEVRAECLDYALTNQERYGIYGGKSERERRRLKHRTALPIVTVTRHTAASDCKQSAHHTRPAA